MRTPNRVLDCMVSIGGCSRTFKKKYRLKTFPVDSLALTFWKWCLGINSVVYKPEVQMNNYLFSIAYGFLYVEGLH